MDSSIQITEKDFPIQPIWLLSNSLRNVLSSIFAGLIFMIYFITIQIQSPLRTPEHDFAIIFLLIVLIYQAFLRIPINFIWDLLRRNNFKYSLEPSFIRSYEGVISKSNRQVPYSTIQHVIIQQNLLDRLFKIASLDIENAGQSGGLYNMESTSRSMGTSGSKLIIPGLSINDAEELKVQILNKIEETKGRDLGM